MNSTKAARAKYSFETVPDTRRVVVVMGRVVVVVGNVVVVTAVVSPEIAK